MTRFSLEDKLKAINIVTDGQNSVKGVARELDTPRVNVQVWLAFYESYGIEGLTMKCTKADGQFKLDVITYMSETGSSLIQTAVHFKIPSPSSIIRWKNILNEQGVDALFSMKKGRPTVKKINRKESVN